MAQPWISSPEEGQTRVQRSFYDSSLTFKLNNVLLLLLYTALSAGARRRTAQAPQAKRLRVTTSAARAATHQAACAASQYPPCSTAVHSRHSPYGANKVVATVGDIHNSGAVDGDAARVIKARYFAPAIGATLKPRRASHRSACATNRARAASPRGLTLPRAPHRGEWLAPHL
jgi:hypothetical protein